MASGMLTTGPGRRPGSRQRNGWPTGVQALAGGVGGALAQHAHGRCLNSLILIIALTPSPWFEPPMNPPPFVLSGSACTQAEPSQAIEGITAQPPWP